MTDQNDATSVEATTEDTSMKTPVFYFMASAQVAFGHPQIEGQVEAITVNVMVQSENSNIRMLDLQRLNAGAAATVQQKLGMPVQILDIIILNMWPLGLMSDETFLEGMAEYEAAQRAAYEQARKDHEDGEVLKAKIEAAANADDDKVNYDL